MNLDCVCQLKFAVDLCNDMKLEWELFQYTVKLQWFKYLWPVYGSRFELIFESTANSSDSSRKQIFLDILQTFFFFIILSWTCMLCVFIRIYLIEVILMRTLNIPLFYKRLKRHPEIIPICFLTWHYDKHLPPPTPPPPPHQWLEPSIFRTNYHGPKDVQTIEVLYTRVGY